MKTEDERKIDFLIGLARLTRETGIAISGCGCCGSPSIDAVEPGALTDSAGYGYGYAGEVLWVSQASDHDWDKYSASIVREA